jgi:hypothetical protein
MAIGAMAAFSSAFMNGTLFHRLKLGDRKSTISVSIEPLSQADIVSANPIPIYITIVDLRSPNFKRWNNVPFIKAELNAAIAPIAIGIPVSPLTQFRFT